MSQQQPRSEITTPEPLGDEEVSELSLRPQRLAEFIGQDKVKESLQIAIDAALNRHEPLDHTLFYGPPGLGKTTLALLMARELGVSIKVTAAPVLEKPADLVRELTTLREGDILFIDEIHRLRPIIEEFLYPAMEDWRIDVRLSDGPHAQMITMPIEKFTLIGATTRYGLLTPPMRARFGIVQRLHYYPVEHLAFVVERTARDPGRGVRQGGGDGDRAALPRHPARGQPADAPRARLRPGARGRPHRPARGGPGAADAGRGRVRAGRHGYARAALADRAVRRRAGGAEHAGGGAWGRTRGRWRRCTSPS